MSDIETKTEGVDYKARARRAWETRRANAKKGTTAAPVARGKIGRPRKVTATGRKAASTVTFGGLEVTSAVYTFDQVKEIGAAAVTTDGSSYRLLRQNGALVPASFFSKI